MPHLGVDPDDFRVFESVDERQRVPDGRQQDVAARLVRLRLDREPDVVALVEDVPRQQVQALGVPVERHPHVFRRARLRALPAAPEHVGLRAELRGQVEVAHHLRQGEPPHLALVRGERAVLEHRMAEQVRGRRGDHQAGLLQCLAERRDPLLPLGRRGVEVEHVVVVEVHAVGAELRKLADRPVGRHRRPHGAAEHVDSLPAHRPDAEGELVFPGRHIRVCSHGLPLPLIP